MEQVWFAGVHTDVGGGYAESGLSDISLNWMLSKAVHNGIHIYSKHKVQVNPDVNGVMHNPFDGLKGKIWRRETRSWDYEKHGKPKIHSTVKDRERDITNSESSTYKPWILANEYDVV